MKENNPISGEWNSGMKHLDSTLKESLIKSEIEGGMNITKIPVGRTLIIQTLNTTYLLEHRENGYFISGNEKYCPEPKLITIIGSKFAVEGSAYSPNDIRRGLHLEFKLDKEKNPITTSEIQEIFMLDDGKTTPVESAE